MSVLSARALRSAVLYIKVLAVTGADRQMFASCFNCIVKETDIHRSPLSLMTGGKSRADGYTAKSLLIFVYNGVPDVFIFSSVLTKVTDIIEEFDLIFSLFRLQFMDSLSLNEKRINRSSKVMEIVIGNGNIFLFTFYCLHFLTSPLARPLVISVFSLEGANNFWVTWESKLV